jgi:hypothetical protein
MSAVLLTITGSPMIGSTVIAQQVISSSSERQHLLTVAEIARELRCSKAHVHHLIAGTVRGVPILPSIRLGRRRLVLRVTFDGWLQTTEHAAD